MITGLFTLFFSFANVFPVAASELKPFTDDSFAGALSQIRETASGMSDELHAQHLNFDNSEVIALLKDPDPAVRKAALSPAKDKLIYFEIRQQLLAMAQNSGEQEDVRVATIKVLCYAANNYEIKQGLLGIAQQDKVSSVRAMAYKALHNVFPSDSEITGKMTEAARSEKERSVRLGAIWGLFGYVGDYDVRSVLLDIVKNDKDAGMRVEAIKSLYQEMPYSEVRDPVFDIAKNSGELKEVRIAALRALSGCRDSEITDFLDNVIKNEQDPDLRSAAVRAMAADIRETRDYFHLGYRLETGGYVSPIDNE